MVHRGRSATCTCDLCLWPPYRASCATDSSSTPHTKCLQPRPSAKVTLSIRELLLPVSASWLCLAPLSPPWRSRDRPPFVPVSRLLLVRVGSGLIAYRHCVMSISLKMCVYIYTHIFICVCFLCLCLCLRSKARLRLRMCTRARSCLVLWKDADPSYSEDFADGTGTGRDCCGRVWGLSSGFGLPEVLSAKMRRATGICNECLPKYMASGLFTPVVV